MSTLVNYNRYFSTATASPGDVVQATIIIFFNSPVSPSVNVWLNNLGDNFAGSQIGNGPLIGIPASTIFSSANLVPNTADTTFVPNVVTDRACFRAVTAGVGGYPVATSPLSNQWRPLLQSTLTVIQFDLEFLVRPTATIGTVVGVPVRVSPTNNAVVTNGALMIDLGSDMTLNILSGSPGGGLSRTLTIVAQPCFSDEAFIKLNVGGEFQFSPVDALRPSSILTSSTGESVELKYAVRFTNPAFSFIRIQKDALGEDTPSRTLYICRGHPVLFAGQSVNPEDLIGTPGIEEVVFETIEEGKKICTLVTSKRVFVNVDGLFVATWSEAGWENAIKSETRFENLKWEKIDESK